MSEASKELHTVFLRRELIRRFISYYQYLHKEEKQEYHEGQRRPFEPVDKDPEVTYNEFDDQLKFYDNMIARRAKLEELRTLMKIELQVLRDGAGVDPKEEDFKKAEKGYPSFMKPWYGKSGSPKLHWKYIETGTSFHVGDGPAQHRDYLSKILEKLVAGKETEDDLKRLDSFLLHIYIKKNPETNVVNKLEHDKMDFHQRMTRDIRRKQYHIGIREGSRSPDRLYLSMSPTAIRPPKLIIPQTDEDGEIVSPTKNFVRQTTGKEGLRKRQIEAQVLDSEHRKHSEDELVKSIVKKGKPTTHMEYSQISEMSPTKRPPPVDIETKVAGFKEIHKTFSSGYKYAEKLKTPSKCDTKDGNYYSGMRKREKDRDKHVEITGLRKSPNDPRKYALIRIKANGMHCLLISDPDTDHSANAIKVRVGHYEDPEEYHGMTTLMEHMLFNGSEKYPDPADFDDFLGNNDGYTNAFLNDMDTVCSLKTDNSAIYQSMDRLSDLFKQPLFREEFTQNEINAVGEEFDMLYDDPDLRYDRMLEYVSNSESFVSKFWCGNNQTLNKEGVRDAVKAYYDQYYSANQMFAVCYSSNELPDMIKNAVKIYGGIKNHKAPKLTYVDKPLPYVGDNLKKIVKMKTNIEYDELSVYFTLDFCELDKEDHLNYIKGLITLKGDKTLFGILHKEHLVDRIDAYVKRFGDAQLIFIIKMKLSDTGLKNWKQIPPIIMEFFRWLRDTGLNEDYYNELAMKSDRKWKYLEKKDPWNYCEQIAVHFGRVDLRNLLKAQMVWNEWCPKKISEALDHFTWDNCNYVLGSPNIKFGQTMVLNSKNEFEEKNQGKIEPYFDIEYEIEDFGDDFIASLADSPNTYEFKYPNQNKFAPRNFEVLSVSQTGARSLGTPSDARSQVGKKWSDAKQEVKEQIAEEEEEPQILYVEGRPFVLFVAAGPGVPKEGFCEDVIKKYEGFVHLSVAQLLKNESSNEMKEKVAKGGVGKAPASLLVKLIKTAMEGHGWNSKRYLISGYPRNQRDVAFWNEEMGSIVSTMGVLYFNQTYLNLKNLWTAMVGSQGIYGSNNESTFNTIFSNWKTECVPIIEKFRPKKMLYEVECWKNTPEETEIKVREIIDRLLLLEHENPFKKSKISLASNVSASYFIDEDVHMDDLRESMPYPIKIHSEIGEDVWYKIDDTFFVPKVSAQFRFYLYRDYSQYYTDNMSDQEKLERLLLDDLYLEIWKDLFLNHHFAQEVQMGKDVECKCEITIEQKYFNVYFDGYSDSMKNFMQSFAEKMESFKFYDNVKAFNSVAEAVKKRHVELWKKEPYSVAVKYARYVMLVGLRPHHTYTNMLEKINQDDFYQFCSTRIWNRLFIESYFGGNLMQEDAMEFYQTLNKGFYEYKNYEKLKRSDWNSLRKTRVLQLREQEEHVFVRINQNGKERSSAVLKHFQIEKHYETQKMQSEGYENAYVDPYQLGDVLPLYNKDLARKEWIRDEQVFNWLEYWLKDLFYKEFRTDKQIADVVIAYKASYQGVRGFNFVLQSSQKEPSDVSSMIDNWLVSVEKQLENLNDIEFNAISKATEKAICSKPKSLENQSEVFFLKDIVTHQYIFDRVERYREEIQGQKKWEIQNVFRKMFLGDGKVLETHIVSKKHQVEADTNLRNRNHYHIGNIRMLHSQCKTYDDGFLFK